MGFEKISLIPLYLLMDCLRRVKEEFGPNAINEFRHFVDTRLPRDEIIQFQPSTKRDYTIAEHEAIDIDSVLAESYVNYLESKLEFLIKNQDWEPTLLIMMLSRGFGMFLNQKKEAEYLSEERKDWCAKLLEAWERLISTRLPDELWLANTR